MKKSILVADDSITMRKMISSILENEGYEVTAAIDGIEAVDYAKSRSFDLFLIDQNMPHMDGLTLIKTLRLLSQHATTPIVVHTRESRGDVKEKCREAGASGWIQKPCNPDNLIKVIRKLTA